MWPDRYPVEALEETRKALGSYLWAALGQGRPVPPDGLVLKRETFRYWEPAGDAYQLGGKAVPAEKCRKFMTVDLATSTKTTADYTVATVWTVTPDNDLLLLHRVRVRVPAPEQAPLLRGRSQGRR